MYCTYHLVSGASPPSELNGRFFYMFVTGTVHIVMLLILRAHVLSHSPTVRSIQLVIISDPSWRARVLASGVSLPSHVEGRV